MTDAEKLSNEEVEEVHFRYYDRMMRKKEPVQNKPDSCAHCPYYQPDFRYRYCLYAECPYQKQENVFRRKPLLRDKYAGKEAVG